MTDWLIFAATGAFAGLMAGLFGVGGGLIMVPILALLLPFLDVAPAVTMQVAIGTSLAVISFTSLSSAAAHHRRGGVDVAALLRLAPGLIVGAWLGAAVADRLSGELLRTIVGTGALLVAAQMALGRQPTGTATTRPGGIELFGAGTVIGAASALIGIGGGSLSVPYLSLRGLGIHRAVGTAAAAGIPIAWGGAAGFIYNGWDVPGIPTPALGYVLLSAWVGMGLFSVLTAPLGARLAHAARPQTLKRGFALLLVVIGLHLLLG
jgi:uncharacterized protein